MTNTISPPRLTLCQSAIYQIKVQGLLSDGCAAVFDTLDCARDTTRGITILSGPVADQTALHGLLTRIRDLGLPLLSVECVESQMEVDYRNK